MTKKPSICFIAHNAYGVLAGIDTGHSGGIEVQVPFLANWFAENGYATSFICWGDHFSEDHYIGKVKVLRLCRSDEGLPVLRFIHPRWSSFVAAMKRADSDIYYYNCGDLGLGQLALWANAHKKKVVYSIASEFDCTRELQNLNNLREKFLYRYGLQHADTIVCQTYRQQSLLQENYNISAVKINMPSKGYPYVSEKKERFGRSSKHRILWVGRISEVKRLEWLLEIARACPDIQFDVVGDSNIESGYARELVKEGSAIPNVILHGRIPHQAMGEFYANADILCSTSRYEGFPNVFLEACSVGVPIVSTVDPDDIIKNHNIGRTAHSVPDLVAAIRELLRQEHWPPASDAAFRYYRDNHRPDSIMRSYQALFEEVHQAK